MDGTEKTRRSGGERDRRPTLGERAARLLALPAGTLGGSLRLTLTGDRDLYLEGYRGVLAYGREEIHVDGGKWVLRVRGRGLEIAAMGPGQLRVSGPVDGLELV